MKRIVKITRIEHEMKDVKRLILEKPKDFTFIPGHSVMVSINKPSLEGKKIPLTFTSTNHDNHIEFILKKYSNTLSEVIFSLKAGDELILNEMFGTVRYNGKGVFIAGG
ncbi:MAG: flavodoxin reductase, partial [Deltaproteobacteria bacterium]|nr:flavodoxin reductase [Deltaproteobacteria bacterium]